MTDQIDLEELIDAKKRETNMTTLKKRQFRIGKLETVGQVCGELAKLYRRCAHGHIDSNTAARQSSILANLRAGLEQGIVEQRLTAIEDQILHLAANQHRSPILLNSHPLEAKDDEHEPSTPRKN
jgi:hypothetical protein